MLLDNNTKKVFDLIDMYDNLNIVDKVRLAIYLLENKNFYILNKLDPSYSKNIFDFAKYKHLLFFSAKYLELTEKEKKNFTIKMLFNLSF